MAGQSLPPTSEGDILELVIPSKPELTGDVDQQVGDFLSHLNYDASMRDDIAIAVNEVVKNAILHGNRCDATKDVSILCIGAPDQFTITVRDQGRGFDPDEVPDPLDPENLLKESGRGLLILRILMDEVRFEFTPGQGTTVTLVKHSVRT